LKVHNLSLTVKWLLVQSGAVILVLMTVGWFLYQTFKDEFYEHARKNAESTSQVFQEMLAEHPELFTTSDMTPVVLRFSQRIPNVSRVIVADPAGRVVADSGNEPVGRILADPDVNWVSEKNIEKAVFFSGDDGNYLNMIVPLEGQYDPERRSNNLGVVILTLHLDREERELFETFAFAIAILIALAAALLLPLNFAYRRQVIQPLRQLGEAAGAIGAGEFSARISLDRGDELGTLARTFNAMAAELEAKEAQRREATEALRFSEEQFRLVSAAAHEALYDWDIAAGGATLPESYGRMFGFQVEKDKLYPLEFWESQIHPEDIEEVTKSINTALESSAETWSAEFRQRCHDGSYLHIHDRAYIVRDAQGQPVRMIGAISDITARKNAEMAVRESEERFRQLAETVNEVFWVFDLVGQKVLYISPAYERIWGQSCAALYQNPFNWLEAIHPDDRVRIRSDFERLTAADFEWEYRILRPDGAQRWIYARTFRVHDPEGTAIRSVGVAEDITERKLTQLSLAKAKAHLERTVVELETARQAAEAGSRAKSQFLAAMSHEIRTPMNGVIGMLGVLLDGDLKPRQREVAEIARASADNLLTVINDILDFSRIEAGKMLVEPVAFHLGSIIEEVRALVSVEAAEKGVEVLVNCSSKTPPRFIGDAGRIRQVLLNLAGNAVKFTERGRVLIDVEAEEVRDDVARLRFRITDTGIGIAEDQLERLFSVFTQADTSTTRKYGGTGLGLAISKRLVELMGGTIGVTSRVGEGSTFSFTLTLPVAPESSGSERTKEAGPVPVGVDLVKPWRVLVVEDHPVNQRVARLMLEQLGCRVDMAANGQEALDQLRLLPYDVVLMDGEMPVMDGFTTTREIRRRERDGTRQLIIAMTAKAMQGDRERCLKAGMDDYLPKPVKLEDLVRVLRRWQNQREPDEAPTDAAAAQAAPPLPRNGVDQSVLDQLRAMAEATDPALLERIITAFVTDTRKRLERLRRAVAAGDAETVRETAHALKGASASVGAHRMAELALEIELASAESLDGVASALQPFAEQCAQVNKVLVRYLKAMS